MSNTNKKTNNRPSKREVNRSHFKSSRGSNNPKKFDGAVVSRPQTSMTIPNSIGIIADKLRVHLTFNKSTGVSLATLPYGVISFRPTAAYDVDPTLGSTVTPGFQEWAAFYGSYRVLSSRIVIRATNPSNAVPVSVCIVPTNVFAGSSPSANYTNALKEQAYNKWKMIGLVGSPPITLSNQMTSEKIFGTKAVIFDDNFSALTNAIPANNWFWTIGLTAPSTVSQLIYLDISVIIDVEFFNRVTLQQ